MYSEFPAVIEVKHDRFQQVPRTVRTESQLPSRPLFILASEGIGNEEPPCRVNHVLVGDAVLERGLVHLHGSKRNTKRLVTQGKLNITSRAEGRCVRGNGPAFCEAVDQTATESWATSPSLASTGTSLVTPPPAMMRTVH